MAERCYHRDQASGNHFVNASFASVTDGQSTCVSNDISLRYQVSDVCILESSHTWGSICTWNSSSGAFVTKNIPEYVVSPSLRAAGSNVYSEIFDRVDREGIRNVSRNLVLHTWDGQGQCTQTRTFGRRFPAHLFCKNNSYVRGHAYDYDRSVCLYVSERWVMLSTFNNATGLFPVSHTALPSHLVYRNLRGAHAFHNL